MPSTPVPPDSDTDPDTRPTRVLVVENHPDSRTMLCLLLRHLGCEVRSVDSVAAALDALDDERPDVLLSDIGLHDGDGWELMLRVPSPERMYAVAMSGFGMAADRQRSLSVGYRCHLVKPVDITQLEQVLDDARAERASDLSP